MRFRIRRLRVVADSRERAVDLRIVNESEQYLPIPSSAPY